ncbi:MAG: hypothetical protein AAFP13_05765 [Pseudomonadota bacterium]
MKHLAFPALLLGLGGCVDPANAPLVFSQTQVLGVGVETGPRTGPPT